MIPKLLLGGLCAALIGCNGGGATGAGGAGATGGGGDAGSGGVGPTGGTGGTAGDPGPPGMPTVTPIAEFDSEIFRQGATLVELADGRVFVAGGLILRSPPGGGGGVGTGREEIEIFDVANRTYVETAPLREGRVGASSVLLPDGTVLITGGAGGPPGEVRAPRDSAEIFDPETNFSTVQPERMNMARSGHGSWLLSSGPNAGKVLIAGGTATSGPELYDPDTGMFTPLGATNAPPGGAGFPVLLDTEQVLFVGAPSDLGDDFRGYHLYDPTAGAFSDLGLFTMSGRSRHTVTKLQDGRVLMAGGTLGNSGINNLDVYDPSDDSITPSGQLLEGPRYLHSASVLPSGRVALISGFSAPGESLSTVAIWDPAAETVIDAAGEVGLGRAFSQALTLSSGEIFVIGGQIVINQSNTMIVPNVDIISE